MFLQLNWRFSQRTIDRDVATAAGVPAMCAQTDFLVPPTTCAPPSKLHAVSTWRIFSHHPLLLAYYRQQLTVLLSLTRCTAWLAEAVKDASL